jgi:ADP-ribosylglycohydrolase
VDLAKFWQDRCFYTCCEYGIFLHNYQRGIEPPLSGTWNNPFFIASEGCPIRSEIWGFICPGNPRLAAEYAALDGCLDHGHVSIEIEQFLAAAAAEAFFCNDLDQVLDLACKVVPPDSQVIEVLKTTREIVQAHPNVYDSWRMIIRRYGSRDSSKAVTNLAIVFMALFLGEKDFKKIMNICVQSGWDADCSAATAGALFGVLYGTKSLPEDWIERMGKTLICAVEIKHKHTSLTDFAAETALLGIEMAQCRNPMVKIVDAPKVTVRPAPAPEIFMTTQYPDTPVLWSKKSTHVQLLIHNPDSKDFQGLLDINTPQNIICGTALSNITIAANSSKTVDLVFSRKDPQSYVADKNLFVATLTGGGKQKVLEYTFGLGGARQWQVYGPYWDMWNKDKYEVCPYQCEELKCNPANIGYQDYFNQHLRFDHHYLDESRLLKEDIPSELPFWVELGEDKITSKEMGGFFGASCYYLVRTIRSQEELKDIVLGIGRNCPYKMWFDGKLIDSSEVMTCWAPEYDANLKVDLTTRPQRLVVKIVAQADSFAFSVNFCGTGDPTRKRGVSIYVDTIEELPDTNLKAADSLGHKLLDEYTVPLFSPPAEDFDSLRKEINALCQDDAIYR